MSKKEKISNLLFENLDYVYCENCRGGQCEDCNRKQIGWEISKGKADEVAEEILKLIEE